MANNKVQLADGTTLIDLTSDTVTPQTMLAGATAHAANGEQITGVVNLANASDSTPLANSGTGSAGSSNEYARGDHRHPAIKVPTLYLKNTGATTITDTTFGFIDTGLSAGTYALLAAYAWMNTNISVRISNLYSGSGGSSNYRVQLLNASGQLITSGTYYIYLVYVRRSDLTNAT